MHAPRSLGAYGVTLVLGLFGVSGLIQKCAPPSVSAPIDISFECKDLVNVARAEAGLAPVEVSGELNLAAEGHSTDQAQRQTLTHKGSNGSSAGKRMSRQGYAWSTWGENVGAGQADCPTVVAAWLNSPGHRENILNPVMVHIGVGAVAATDGTIYWTMDLAAPR
ncbi:MAG: CAP domain-containing protein [Ilumatobacteraceae bacterium]